MSIRLSSVQATTLRTLRHGPIVRAVKSPTTTALVAKGYAEFDESGNLVITEKGKAFIG